MQKLVLKLYITDGYTYGYDLVLPFEYESKEKALFDLELLYEKHVTDKNAGIHVNSDVKFCGHEFSLYELGYKDKFDKDCVFTLDEWFEQNKAN